MKKCLNFCKENENYIITEKDTNKRLVVIRNKLISIVEIFNSIFMNFIISHETCNLEIENSVTNDEAGNDLFITVKALLEEISTDVNNYLKSLATQI